MYTMYSGPEKSYTALRKVTGRSEEECAKRCTEELACDAVKVKQVTGTGNNECALLTVQAEEVMATDTYEMYYQKVNGKVL